MVMDSEHLGILKWSLQCTLVYSDTHSMHSFYEMCRECQAHISLRVLNQLKFLRN